jgi:hypothetical protein
MGHDSTVWAVAFDGPGWRMASCSDDRTLRIWHATTPSATVAPSPSTGADSAAVTPLSPIIDNKRGGSELQLDAGVAAANEVDNLEVVSNRGGIAAGMVQPSNASSPMQSSQHQEPCGVRHGDGAPAPSRPHWRHAATISGYHTRAILTVDWHRAEEPPAMATGGLTHQRSNWVATGMAGDSLIDNMSAVGHTPLLFRSFDILAFLQKEAARACWFSYAAFPAV